MKMFPAAALVFLAVSAPAAAFGGSVLTVDWGGFGGYTTIQSAVDDAFSGDEVRVAAGTYFENVVMADGVSLYGGYEASGWTRDIEANVTVIDAGGCGSTVTASDNATLDGFTIKGCAPTGIVAGVYIYAASPTVSNNIITQNGRHGVYVENSASPEISHNIIYSNGYYGVYCYSFGGGGSPSVLNNTIDNNRRGFNSIRFAPLLRNNIFSSNTEYGIYGELFSVVDTDYNDSWDNAQGDFYAVEPGSRDVSVDPLYVGGGDYHLDTSPVMSPCIDAGVDVGFAYTGLPDMGRYESAATQPNPWPPDGLVATPLVSKVRLEWTANKEPNLAGYKVSYGNAPGSYTVTIDVGNVTSFFVPDLINDAAYFFAVKAYNTLTNESGYSDEVSATPSAAATELPHYDWDASFLGDCTGCHVTQSGGNLLPAGFDYHYDTGLCLSCHNITGQARALLIDESASHPVFVNATTGGNNLPTYGNITGRFSNRMGDHLDPDGRIVCNTCHNVMEKTEDPGRVWEMTTVIYPGWYNYQLANGGWSYYDFMLPEVYRTTSLMEAPTDVKDRRPYRMDDPLQYYEPDTGKIVFRHWFQDNAYVTLRYEYLRASNTDNTMCLDCHNTATHEMMNCLTCHETHNYANRMGIRPNIRTPNSGIGSVVFTNFTGPGSYADGDTVFDGICEVCHTKTLYYRFDGSVLNNHTSGQDYSGTDCLVCHTHVGGFYP